MEINRFIKLLRIVGLSYAARAVMTGIELPALWSANGKYFFSKDTQNNKMTVFKMSTPFYLCAGVKVLAAYNK